MKGWMEMLRGKRAVITGGGAGFGQALCVWLAREGVEVHFSARRADDIQKLAASSRLKVGVQRVYLWFNPAWIHFSVFFTAVIFRQAHRHFNSQCRSVAVRHVRRSTRYRNHQYRQFRPDRFNSTDSGFAIWIKTFWKRGYRLNYIFMWDPEFYRFNCAPRFFC